MKYRISSKILTVLLLLALAPGLVGCQARTAPPSPLSESLPVPDHKAQTITFCELVNNPMRYNGELLRTQAIIWAGLENQSIYDPSCYSEDVSTWIEYGNKEAFITLDDALNAFRGGHRATRVNATLVGRFDVASKEGVGHLNGFKFQFSIIAVENVQAVPSEIPWPWQLEE